METWSHILLDSTRGSFFTITACRFVFVFVRERGRVGSIPVWQVGCHCYHCQATSPRVAAGLGQSWGLRKQGKLSGPGGALRPRVYPTAEFSLASFTGSRCGAAGWSPPVATQRPGLGQWPGRTIRPWQRIRVMILLTWQLAFHISGIYFILTMKDYLLNKTNLLYLSPSPDYLHKNIAFLAFKRRLARATQLCFGALHQFIFSQNLTVWKNLAGSWDACQPRSTNWHRGLVCICCLPA